MGTVQSIIVRPERKLPPRHVANVEIGSNGIAGDHYDKEDGLRSVTLVASDDLAEVAATIGFQGDPHLACRRNIMVDTFPEGDLTGKIVELGDQVVLEITGYCKPCTRMEENFGEGAVNALLNKAGWSAKIIEGGSVSVGDHFILK